MSKTLREEISEFRARHKLDQAGFAKGTGYSRKFIGHIERGRRQPSEEGALRIRAFIETATDMAIASLRGPGAGNSSKPHRRGRRLNRRELDRVELNRMAHDELEDELGELLKKF